MLITHTHAACGDTGPRQKRLQTQAVARSWGGGGESLLPAPVRDTQRSGRTSETRSRGARPTSAGGVAAASDSRAITSSRSAGRGSPQRERDREGLQVVAPKAPSVRLLWEEKAVEAVLRFLEDTRVGCIVTPMRPPEEEGGGGQ